MDPDSLIVLIILGLIGQITRVLLQVGEHGQPDPKEYWKIAAKLLLGAIGGWLAWELANAPIEAVQAVLPDFIAELVLISRVLAFALGFIFPDIAENLIVVFNKWTNRGDGD